MERREGWGDVRRGRGEHATECPKPLEQGIFLVDWAIHSRHVTLNFFHYKTLLPSPLQRQIACTYFTQWNIASPLKQYFSSQSCEKKNFFEAVISLCLQSIGILFSIIAGCVSSTLFRFKTHFHNMIQKHSYNPQIYVQYFARQHKSCFGYFIIGINDMWHQISLKNKSNCYCRFTFIFTAEVRVLQSIYVVTCGV